MKKNKITLNDIRGKVKEMVGEPVTMQVCRGRKIVRNYKGTLASAFPHVFSVQLEKDSDVVDTLVYSYSDILCGEVIVEKVS
ncbi:MAG: Veg family protein [Firmicutes bacterium]|nr:Veg family protein [Bacillota bacterium]